MNNKTFIVIVLLILVGFIGYWLNDFLDVSGWVTSDGKQWNVKATGWSILSVAWPITLFGVIVSLPISLIGIYYLLHKANESDQKDVLTKLTKEVEAAKQEAKSANDRAEQKYLQRNQQLTEQEELLEEKHQVMTKLRQQFAQWKTEQEQLVKEANTRAEAAIKQAEMAEQRKINAAGAAERRRRKIQRLENGKQTT